MFDHFIMKTQLLANNIKPINKANKSICHSDNFINYLNYKTKKLVLCLLMKI